MRLLASWTEEGLTASPPLALCHYVTMSLWSFGSYHFHCHPPTKHWSQSENIQIKGSHYIILFCYRSSGRSAAFLLAPAEGWGALRAKIGFWLSFDISLSSQYLKWIFYNIYIYIYIYIFYKIFNKRGFIIEWEPLPLSNIEDNNIT